MEDKNALVNSITNLINHIVASKKNQIEIFNSLTKKDLQKIINNINDPFQKLRIITLILISQLLSSNQQIKVKFCQILNIHPSPGKIVINSLNKLQQTYPVKLRQIFGLLKGNNVENHPSASSHLWYIDLSSKNLKINFYFRDQVTIDPNNCIIGFVFPKPIVQSSQQNSYNTIQYKTFTEFSDHKSSKPAQKPNFANIQYKITKTQNRQDHQKSIQLKESNTKKDDLKVRMSLQLDDLPSKAKQGIKIMSHRHKLNTSEFIEKKFDKYKPQTTTYRANNSKTINLGGTVRGYETNRQKKNISKFSMTYQ